MNRAWKGLILAMVAIAPWLAGLSHPFLYDDVGMIAENEFLADPSNLREVLSGRTMADPQVVNGRRPAVLASYFLDRALYGLRPAGWRLTSLLLHLGCTGMLMALVRRLGGRGFSCFAAGLLFALHPVQVEAVHAPGFRADVLCLFFMLAALHGFLSMRDRPVAGWLWGGGCTALALLSKETALALPLILGGAMVLFPASFSPGRGARLAGIAICLGLAGGFFVWWAVLPVDLQALSGSWNGESLRFPETLYSLPAIWSRTVRLLLWPWPLNVTPLFEAVTSMGSGRFWLGVLVLGLCLAGAWRLRTSAPREALGLSWMLVFFLPVSNLWPLLHPVADRYLYPIVPGLSIVVAGGLVRLPGVWRRRSLATLAALYAALILLRVAEWKSAESLWTAAHARNPHSATAATWLGLLGEQDGDAEAARAWYREATLGNPHAVAAWINWGILEGRAENWADSERLLRRAVAVRPESGKAWHNLAVCLERQGKTEESAAAASRAADRQPAYGSEKP